MHTSSVESGADPSPLVDPRAPRVGQAITASGLLLGIAFREPLLILAVATILNTAVLSGWRINFYGLLWQHGLARFVDPATRREDPAPHRFATLIGAAGTAAALGFYLLGFPMVTYGIAAAIAGAAGLGATTGFCLGCQMYRSVSTLRRLDVV